MYWNIILKSLGFVPFGYETRNFQSYKLKVVLLQCDNIEVLTLEKDVTMDGKNEIEVYKIVIQWFFF